jgi:hypothetical protein
MFHWSAKSSSRGGSSRRLMGFSRRYMTGPDWRSADPRSVEPDSAWPNGWIDRPDRAGCRRPDSDYQGPTARSAVLTRISKPTSSRISPGQQGVLAPGALEQRFRSRGGRVGTGWAGFGAGRQRGGVMRPASRAASGSRNCCAPRFRPTPPRRPSRRAGDPDFLSPPTAEW